MHPAQGGGAAKCAHTLARCSATPENNQNCFGPLAHPPLAHPRAPQVVVRLRHVGHLHHLRPWGRLVLPQPVRHPIHPAPVWGWGVTDGWFLHWVFGANIWMRAGHPTSRAYSRKGEAAVSTSPTPPSGPPSPGAPAGAATHLSGPIHVCDCCVRLKKTADAAQSKSSGRGTVCSGGPKNTGMQPASTDSGRRQVEAVSPHTAGPGAGRCCGVGGCGFGAGAVLSHLPSRVQPPPPRRTAPSATWWAGLSKGMHGAPMGQKVVFLSSCCTTLWGLLLPQDSWCA